MSGIEERGAASGIDERGGQVGLTNGEGGRAGIDEPTRRATRDAGEPQSLMRVAMKKGRPIWMPSPAGPVPAMVRATGIEPARSLPHWNLNPARLPVPPRPRVKPKNHTPSGTK